MSAADQVPTYEEENDCLFQRAKAFLMQADHDGQCVYDLLYQTIYSMMEENPQDVANHPERIQEALSMLKKYQFQNFSGAAFTTAVEARAAAPTDVTQSVVAQKVLKLMEQPKSVETTTIEKPAPNITITTTKTTLPRALTFNSVSKDNTMWSYCGYGLPAEEAFVLDQSISALIRAKDLKEVRFFGKIFGLYGNYIVVTSQRVVTPQEEPPFREVNIMPKKASRKNISIDIQSEPGYKGVNRLSFWVASEAATIPNDWTLLSDTTPQLINYCRNVKKAFTGRFDTPILATPPFYAESRPGEGTIAQSVTEREYLRAQLSRILAGTYINPSGALERPDDLDDEDEEPEEDESGKPLSPKPAKYVPLTRESKEYAPDTDAGVQALLDLEQWVHSEMHIMRNGRMSILPPKPDEDEEEEPEEDEIDEEDEEAEDKGEDLVEETEEEEKELFQPIKADALYGVIDLPKEPNPEDDEEVEEDSEDEDEQQEEVDPEVLAEREREEEATMKKPVFDEDVADDDPLKKKISAWTTTVVNAIYKKHGICCVRSVRWPGAIAYAAQSGKQWGCVYLGNGIKQSDYNYGPVPALKVQRECKDLIEVMDPLAADEKLVMRGEEPREKDSEDELEDEDEEN